MSPPRPLPPRTRVVVLALLAAIGATQVACVTVRPSERQVLSRPEMDPAKDADEEVWHSHVESAREGAFGGHGAAGGGCGCG
ncbi:MAG: DUF4266 domain-containing protein [Myxococcales bacterium]|nr:DUF4266 domain-containing protein [Myxococcales bacterium]MCB9568497.1 DUF4266 domain-containing protein [Myxococcales bacterium]MCB9702017.1 DUF4266 domain-containing protein [Myxococcales bacterium]